LFSKVELPPKFNLLRRSRPPNVSFIYTLVAVILNIAIDITLSGDGTSNKAVNYESKFVTILVPDYEKRLSGENPDAMKEIPADRFMGISSAPDHTSETQLAGWQETVREFYDLYNHTPLEHHMHARIQEFAVKIRGLHTDHAKDQKKLARLIMQWRTLTERELRGELYLLSVLPEELLPILMEAVDKKIADAGGPNAWALLSEKEQLARDQTVYLQICLRYGQTAYDALSEADKNEVDFFVWAGCCMHKELNSVKGGDSSMQAFWVEEGLTPPMQLMNRDNAAAASFGPSEARSRAEKVSQAGGTKVTSLAGALFNHKDKKKGHQDLFKWFFGLLGFFITFPDTSNTRYQSHCLAAACLILYLPYFISFLEHCRDKKDSGQFNHMEKNVHQALDDKPTITELCVLAIYSQIISAPYMRSVRGPDSHLINVLDMGPLHEKVIAHCQSIIDNPDLVLAADTSYEHGSLDGQIWENSDVVYRVQSMASDLPHLRGALVAFFKGARDTWKRFSEELLPGGAIANASPSQRQSAFMRCTNDINEGALGSFRVQNRHAPNMTLAQHNARATYGKNDTKFYMRTLNPLSLKSIRGVTRTIDSSGVAAKMKEAQVAADKAKSESHLAVKAATKAKNAAAQARIDAVAPRTDLEVIRRDGVNLDALRLELDWHRKYVDCKNEPRLIPTKTSLDRKAKVLAALIAAVERYNKTNSTPADSHSLDFVSEPSDVDMDEVAPGDDFYMDN
jgi:hypothetical protein